MRRIHFLLLAMLASSTVFAQTTGTTGYVIEGKITSVPDNTVVIFSGFNGTDTLAKAVVQNGSFVLKGHLPGKDGHVIMFPSIKKGFQLFMGNDHVTITGTTADFSDISIEGASYNHDFEEFVYHLKPLGDYVEYYRKQMQAATTQAGRDSAVISLNTVYNIYQQNIEQFIARKKGSPIAALLLAYNYDTDPNKDANVALLNRRFNELTGDALKSQFGINLKKALDIAKIGAVGTPAINFTQNDTLGKPVSLSQFKGKYVLVDFWASWCRPCRAENPNVVAAYNAYKDKNFTILSVSLDQRKENWLYAINADGLAWNHVSDLQYWSNAVARTYHIESIPANFLIDPNGIIIAKNLRGEDLAQKLSEVIK